MATSRNLPDPSCAVNLRTWLRRAMALPRLGRVPRLVARLLAGLPSAAAGAVWPRVAWLAARVRLGAEQRPASDRTIQRALRALARAGLVAIDAASSGPGGWQATPPGGGRRQASNRIRLLVPGMSPGDVTPEGKRPREDVTRHPSPALAAGPPPVVDQPGAVCPGGKVGATAAVDGPKPRPTVREDTAAMAWKASRSDPGRDPEAEGHVDVVLAGVRAGAAHEALAAEGSPLGRDVLAWLGSRGASRLVASLRAAPDVLARALRALGVRLRERAVPTRSAWHRADHEPVRNPAGWATSLLRAFVLDASTDRGSPAAVLDRERGRTALARGLTVAEQAAARTRAELDELREARRRVAVERSRAGEPVRMVAAGVGSDVSNIMASLRL